MLLVDFFVKNETFGKLGLGPRTVHFLLTFPNSFKKIFYKCHSTVRENWAEGKDRGRPIQSTF